VLRYEHALKANKFMLVVHGDMQAIQRAQELLKTSGLSTLDHHGDLDKAKSALHA
jgi:hypothetical protein